jgi:undecaprenyl-diphosphatase
LGLTRKLSAKYSFILSIPAILGGFILSLGQGRTSGQAFGLLALGFFTSALVGYFSLRFLTYVIDRGRLPLFATWCILAAILALLSPFLN